MSICPFCFKSVAPNAAFCRQCGKPLNGVAKCQQCGAAIAPGAKFCNSCGTSAPKTCPQCGEGLVPGAKFCTKCGTSFPNTFWLDANICLKCKAPLKPGAKFCNICGNSCEQAKIDVIMTDDESEAQSFEQEVKNVIKDLPVEKESQPAPEIPLEEKIESAPVPPQTSLIDTAPYENTSNEEGPEKKIKLKRILPFVGTGIVLIIGIIVFLVVKSGNTSENSTNFLLDSRDNSKYRTVTIGKQTWMAENLNYKIRNSWCYDNDPENCITFGRLYSWESAMAACPSGWKLPSDMDWRQLKTFVESQNGQGKAGSVLQSNEFAARLGGDSFKGHYQLLEENGYYWSSTEIDIDRAFDFVFLSKSDDLIEGNPKYALKGNGFSVRCIKK